MLDADALNAVAAEEALKTSLRGRAGRGFPTVLTPHPLEAARLLEVPTASVQSDRLAAARELAQKFSCVVVLKGSGTLDIYVSFDGTGGILQTDNTQATTLKVGENGTTKFALNKNTTTAPLIATTGVTSFNLGTTMAVTPSTFLPESQTYTLVSSNVAGGVHIETPGTTTALRRSWVAIATTVSEVDAAARSQ